MKTKTKIYLISFIVLFILLPAISLSAEKTQETKVEEKVGNDNSSLFFVMIVVSSVFGMAAVGIGAAIAQARTASKALAGVARQPEASGKIFIQMMLALVFIETLAIYTLVVILILIFANPFTKYIVG